MKCSPRRHPIDIPFEFHRFRSPLAPAYTEVGCPDPSRGKISSPISPGSSPPLAATLGPCTCIGRIGTFELPFDSLHCTGFASFILTSQLTQHSPWLKTLESILNLCKGCLPSFDLLEYTLPFLSFLFTTFSYYIDRCERRFPDIFYR